MMSPEARSRSPVTTWIQVLNYKGLDCLGPCLDSLKAARQPAGEVRLVVVDNASDDGSVDMVREEFPDVEILHSDYNLGFAGGNNLGLRRALKEGADYAILVNMDAQVDPECLVKLVEAANDTPEAALVGATICTEDGQQIEFDGGQFDPVLTAGGYSDAPREEPPREGVRTAAYACGAGMLLRLETLRKIGLFSESFFAYHEDVELALRTRLFGYDVVTVPTALVYHVRGGAGAGVHFRDFMGTRNLLLTLFKLYDRESWLQNSAALAGHFLGGDFAQRPQALLSALFEAPVMLRHRRRLRGQALHRYHDVVEQLKSIG